MVSIAFSAVYMHSKMLKNSFLLLILDPVEGAVLMHNACALQCHFLLGHPIAAQEGRDKYRIIQSANTCRLERHVCLQWLKTIL